MDENTRLIVDACKQVVQSADDYDSDTMTTPITVVQAIYQLDSLLDNIKRVHIESAMGANDVSP